MPGADSIDCISQLVCGLHVCITRHDPDAMACTLGRDVRLYGAINKRRFEQLLDELNIINKSLTAALKLHFVNSAAYYVLV